MTDEILKGLCYWYNLCTPPTAARDIQITFLEGFDEPCLKAKIIVGLQTSMVKVIT